MANYVEARDLPNDDKVYLKKGIAGWKVVYPIRNEDGKINWKHLLVGGSYWNLFILILIVGIILGVLYEYSSTINMLLDCFKDPVQLEICKQSFGNTTTQLLINP